MIYELLVKLFGAGIAGLIQFLPFTVSYDAATLHLKIEATLTAPVTKEAQRLAENGMPLLIQYDWSLIVNDARAYHQVVVHDLQCNNNKWYIDRFQETSPDAIQELMGTTTMILPGLRFHNGDRLIIFVKATILPDSTFTRSTRMRTDVLWNYHIPKRKESHLFTGERFTTE